MRKKSKQRKKQNHMVSVQVQLPVTAYLELVATDCKDAIEQAREIFKNGIPEKFVKILVGEAQDNAQYDIDRSTSVKLKSLGKSSQFHSNHECALCKKIYGGHKN